MKIQEMHGMPQEAGFYFVRESNKKYWQCLIRISGDAPFLELTKQDTLFKTTDEIKNLSTSFVFSERLEVENI